MWRARLLLELDTLDALAAQHARRAGQKVESNEVAPVPRRSMLGTLALGVVASLAPGNGRLAPGEARHPDPGPTFFYLGFLSSVVYNATDGLVPVQLLHALRPSGLGGLESKSSAASMTNTSQQNQEDAEEVARYA